MSEAMAVRVSFCGLLEAAKFVGYVAAIFVAAAFGVGAVGVLSEKS